jgi:5'-3' exonuclease
MLRRTKFDKTYKCERKKPEDKDFMIFSGVLSNMLKTMGYEIVHYPGYEGDDVIASLCRVSGNCQIYIMTMDKDLRQLLYRDKVVVVIPNTSRTIYTEQRFINEHGFGIDKYPIYKALIGDKSDSVEGVEGIGPVKAKSLITSCKTVGELLSCLSYDERRKFRHALRLITLEAGVPRKLFRDYLSKKTCNNQQYRVIKKMFTRHYGEELVDGVLNEFKKLLGVDDMMDKIIAVDFDGTLVENKYPDIGEINREVFDAVLEEQGAGAKIILWTCREEGVLTQAIEFCKYNGLVFDAVNDNLEYIKLNFNGNPRKIFAHEYWDDRQYWPGKACRDGFDCED